MQIWTTSRLSNLLLNKDLPVMIIPESELADQFLKNALPTDVSLMNLPGEYMEFLESVRAEGLSGPFIFISEDSDTLPAEAGHPKALHLSMKSMGGDETRRLIDFILRMALQQHEEGGQRKRGDADECKEGRAVQSDKEEIRKALLQPLESSVPIIVSVRVLENGQPVTVRGICLLREILSSGEMILHSFRPPGIINALESDNPLRITVPCGELCYGAFVDIMSIGKGEVRASIPDRLLCEKPRHLRADSSSSNPVKLHILTRNGSAEDARLLDFSENGIGFSTSQDLTVGEVYVFVLLFPESEELILCYGTIRYRKSAESWMYRYGAELKIQPKDRMVLARHLMEREFEILRLLPENREDREQDNS